jgi:hypothetical protein
METNTWKLPTSSTNYFSFPTACIDVFEKKKIAELEEIKASF